MKFKISTACYAMLLTMLLPLMAAAQERLLVLTDPHLLSPALVVNPGQPYTDAINSNNKMIDLGAPIMKAMVDTILAIHPTAVLVSGDLSKDCERRSHQDMVAYLAQLHQILQSRRSTQFLFDASVFINLFLKFHFLSITSCGSSPWTTT